MRLARPSVRSKRRALAGALVLGLVSAPGAQAPGPRTTPAARESSSPPAVSGVQLDDLTWAAAEQRLKPESVVVLPLGAAAQEHGMHLKLGNDLIMARYLTRRLVDVADVTALPPLPYHYFPAFNEYPGSTSLALNTARDLTADVVRSVARHGPRRFYVLNTGYSSAQALAAAAKLLAVEGILLHYTDWRSRIDATRGIQQQPGGNHADEIETSMMLYIDPALVNLPGAQRDYSPGVTTPFQLTRRDGGRGTYSPTGAWGDPSLATREKGRVTVETIVSAIRTDIEDLRRASLPTPSTSVAAPDAGASRPAARPQEPSRTSGDCFPGDDRIIRAIGPAFQLAWTNQDAVNLSMLWFPGGDMAHPDGLVESTREIILQNRLHLFRQPEYKYSRHYLTIGTIRCITLDVAVADAKWELRGVLDPKGQPAPPAEGLCTLVLKRRDGGWGIEAWRYNVKPSTQSTQPTILKKPGFLPPVIR